MQPKCKNSPQCFCYICGQLTKKAQRRKMTPMIKKAYNLYFGYEVRDQDKAWVPHACCVSCGSYLRCWLKKKKFSLNFAIPIIWREPSNHHDCYFCMTPRVTSISSKRRASILTNRRVISSITYPNIPSALRPEIPEMESSDEIEIKEEPFHAETIAEMKLEAEEHPVSNLHINDEDPISMDEANEDLQQTETLRLDSAESIHKTATSMFFRRASSENEGCLATRDSTAGCERKYALDAGVPQETESATAAIATSNNLHASSHENVRKRPINPTGIPDYETEESRYLSTPDLQRLLLIEQLRLTRLQTAFYEKRMKTLPQ